MKRLKPIIDRQGFSLVELLVALTVLAFGLLGVLGMQVFAIRSNAFASNMTVAQNLAVQKIEYFKNFAYNVIWQRDASGTPVIIYFGTQQKGDAGNPEAAYTGISNDTLPTEERFLISTGTLTNNDVLSVDIEDYGALKKDVSGTPLSGSPFDRFRRVTLVKVKNGSATDNMPDCTLVIKVIVFWRGPEGVEHRVSMMTAKGLGG